MRGLNRTAVLLLRKSRVLFWKNAYTFKFRELFENSHFTKTVEILARSLATFYRQ